MKHEHQREVDVVGSFPGLRVLVIGEELLDTFVGGTATRIGREAPVPVEQQYEHHFHGSATNVAANLKMLGAIDSNVTTRRKLRVLVRGQCLVRVDEGTLSTCGTGTRRTLLEHGKTLVPQSDAHGKGGDYTAEMLPEIEAVREVGVQVEILPLLGELRTSTVIDRTLSLNAAESGTHTA